MLVQRQVVYAGTETGGVCWYRQVVYAGTETGGVCWYRDRWCMLVQRQVMYAVTETDGVKRKPKDCVVYTDHMPSGARPESNSHF